MITSAAIPSDSNNCDISGVGGADTNGNPLPLSQLQAQLSDYTNAYLVANGPSSVFVYKRPTFPAGASITVTVKFTGKSQSGTPLPELDIPCTMTSAGVPQATQIIATSNSAHNTQPPAADPGTAPISMI